MTMWHALAQFIPHPHRRLPVLFGTVAALVLLSAGCGDDGGDVCSQGAGEPPVTCEANEYCQYPDSCGATDGVGTCEPRPGACTADCPGVCGCDGNFYCNACTARAAGTDVSDDTSCLPAGGGVACLVDGVTYPDGATDVPDPTSCNTCVCDGGQISACTEIACPEPCPDGTRLGTSCAQCGPADGCEVLETGCLPTCDSQSDCEGTDRLFCTQEGHCANMCL